MLPVEINKRLEDLKGCEKVQIQTIEGKSFVVKYVDIVNDTEQKTLYVKAPHPEDERIFLYFVIVSIN